MLLKEGWPRKIIDKEADCLWSAISKYIKWKLSGKSMIEGEHANSRIQSPVCDQSPLVNLS